MRSIRLLIILLLLPLIASAQDPEVLNKADYPFVNFEGNKLYVADSMKMYTLFDKLNHLLRVGDQQVNIVQIGDSHIQADFFSNQVRQRLQSFFPGGNGGRGFVFPYSVAHTNNPLNYKVNYTGQWSSCRNVQYSKSCKLGLAGISVTTDDSQASISLTTLDKYGLPYDYTKVRMFYEDSAQAYECVLQDSAGNTLKPEIIKDGLAEWKLDKAIRLVHIKFDRIKNTPGASFTLYGLTLETDDPGIVYHAIGVNGAEVVSFLRCHLLAKQLNALQPDLIILSLGTNDAYGANFDSAAFVINFTTLINRIQERNPLTPVILTTPGDCFKDKKYPNRNNLLAERAIFAIAKKQGYAVWDDFAAMGGLGSMQHWHDKGLSAPDKVHLSPAGYELKGDLFFEAFINAYETYTSSRSKR
jgi:hypothetical protein